MGIIHDRKNRKLWQSQAKYIKKVLERFNMSSTECPTSEKENKEITKITYALVLGSLTYAMICTRAYIAYKVVVVNRFLSNPSKKHWAAIRWILKSLRGPFRFCLCYRNGKPEVSGYLDTDYAGDIDSQKSTSTYMMTFVGGVVS